MEIEDIIFCLIRAPGTNCDIETHYALEYFGTKAEIVHINQLLKGEKDLASYHGLVIPGGFSFGDHIRSGAILGKTLQCKFGDLLTEFAEESKPILGICNGFQVLVESGLLPGFKDRGTILNAALGTNTSSKFEDRWVYLKKVNESRCVFTANGNELVRMPVAHGEGKFILPPEEEERLLNELEKNDQIVYKYAKGEGSLAFGSYPENPNGSFADIAGICNPSGTVFGLMPHPERAFQRITYPDWTRTGLGEIGDGFSIFKNLVDFVAKRF
ncbi:MAG: phosphoribosylformylglycinamidine synthase I [Candidatus Hydrothermarchaeales archaeon]